MSKVFVVQFKDQIDLEPAEKFGDLVFLTPQHFQVYESRMVPMDEFLSHLKGFCDRDYIVLNGDPVLIGLATMVASEINEGRVNVLKWDRRNECYKPIFLDLKIQEQVGGVSG